MAIMLSARVAAITYGLMTTLKSKIVRIAPRKCMNFIAPGCVPTLMVQETLDYLAVSGPILAASTPLKKITTPLDIGNRIAVLSSSMVLGHVTEQVIFIEGGCIGDL